MKKSMLLLVLVAIAQTGSTESNHESLINGIQDENNADREGRSEVVEIDGKRYFIGTGTSDLISVQTATDRCNKAGMKLVSFETIEKYNLIAQFLIDYGFSTSTFWTSAKMRQGAWQWTGVGQTVESFKWYATSGQPDYTGTEQACIAFQPLYGWKDDACRYTNRFVCEEIVLCSV